MLNREEVLKIARLARLHLSDSEVGLYQKRLGRVLEYVRELDELETSRDTFVRHVPKDSVAFREDQPLESTMRDLILSNAPQLENDQFLLPKIVDNA